MSLIDWDKGFELGIVSIDEQHKHLIGLLNEAYDNFITGEKHEALEEILDKLVDYSRYHFSLEEQRMTLAGYDGLARHREEHKKFSCKIESFQNDIQSNKKQLMVEVPTFLKNWLIDHILKTDAEFGRFAKLLKL